MKRSTVFSFLVAVIGFGILVPWWKGIDFLDTSIILASSSASLVFAAPMIASSFSEEHVSHQIFRVVGFVWVMAFLILVNGIATVNIRHWRGHLLLPPWSILGSALLLNFCGAIFLAVLTAAVALRTRKPAVGVRTARIGFFALLGILVFLARYSPGNVRSRFNEMMTAEGTTRIVLMASAALAGLSALLWTRIARRAPR